MASKSIKDIEGIGPVYAGKLGEAGIKTVEGLLKKGASKSGRNEISKATGLDAKMILTWVNMADLFRIKGVGEEYSQLLEAAGGVDTVKELRNRNAANLHAKMVEVNTEKKLVRQTPSLSMVEGWVSQAKELEPMVTH